MKKHILICLLTILTPLTASQQYDTPQMRQLQAQVTNARQAYESFKQAVRSGQMVADERAEARLQVLRQRYHLFYNRWAAHEAQLSDTRSFWRKHWQTAAAIVGLLALGGASVYRMTR